MFRLDVNSLSPRSLRRVKRLVPKLSHDKIYQLLSCIIGVMSVIVSQVKPQPIRGQNERIWPIRSCV